MALISCPHCGKSISDSAVKCPYCGIDPKEAREREEKAKLYHMLPLKEQKQLENEFYATDASAKKLKLKSKVLLIVGWLLLVIILSGLVGSLVYYRCGLSYSTTEYNEVVDKLRDLFNNGNAQQSAAYEELSKRLDEMNKEKQALDEIMPYFVVPLAVLTIPMIACLGIQKFGMTKQILTVAKRFQLWLEKEKGIKFLLNPTPRQRAILEKIEGEKKWL